MFWIAALLTSGLLLSAKNTAKAASNYVGMKETSNNSGFINPKFEKLMKQAGWSKGAEWCAFFVKMIWMTELTGKKKELAKKIMTGSSLTTYENFKKDQSGLFETSKIPKPGSVVVWRRFAKGVADGWKGHAGIVSKVTPYYFETIEGNTNENGSPNGDRVARKTRKYDWNNANGLRLIGFINTK